MQVKPGLQIRANWFECGGGHIRRTSTLGIGDKKVYYIITQQYTVELQLIEHPKSNNSTCRNEEILDHTPSLVLYNTFSIC